MTDRVKGFTVALDKDIRIDDVQRIKEAIEMITGVSAVTEEIVDTDDWLARMQVKSQIKGKLLELYESI